MHLSGRVLALERRQTRERAVLIKADPRWRDPEFYGSKML